LRLRAAEVKITEAETEEGLVGAPAEATSLEGRDIQTDADGNIEYFGVGADGDSSSSEKHTVVFVASEVAPWSKTGGLGDVMGSLPGALARRGHRVMVIAPRYGPYQEALDTGVRANVWLWGASHEVGYFHHVSEDGVDFVFVDHPGSFMRMGTPYGDANGEFGDNQFRFSLFTLAALEVPLQVPIDGVPYGQDVTFVANDWHASLIPVFLAAKYRSHGVYLGARSVLAVHNLFHQGCFPPDTFNQLGLPSDWYNCLGWRFLERAHMACYSYGHAINYMKAGLTTADRIVTVSPGYAFEITTPEGGWNMDGILRNRQYVLNGILNGIEDSVWSPGKDKHIAMNYTYVAFSVTRFAELPMAFHRRNSQHPSGGFAVRRHWPRARPHVKRLCRKALASQ